MKGEEINIREIGETKKGESMKVGDEKEEKATGRRGLGRN